MPQVGSSHARMPYRIDTGGIATADLDEEDEVFMTWACS